MYNIGIIQEKERTVNTYSGNLNAKTYRLYQLTTEDVFNEASKMDALIIEESTAVELKDTCELILELRRNFKALIWIVCKRMTQTNKIVYLQLGADGVSDEKEQEEAILQFSNILNRIKDEQENLAGTVVNEREKKNNRHLELVQNNLSIILEGKEISLTRLEFQTITFLLEHIGKAITYEELYKNVWKNDFGNEKEGTKQYRISNLIFHLRKKLEIDPAQPNYIKTVRSKGYMLVDGNKK
ncbi:two-component system, OmpR family, response regulator VicR [Enterococcus sp. DIV0212c]|uniref:winged helix-turn-helix domain-containing protein n=1 Tax=Enterococcus sp. DIV0212c TaxID=2230867 RepID=UPI001A9BA2E3|nr:winged helix-turn-helix domain-containing protein [Enterococcus sp. DIV0212c]MBO1354997.1 winged helix-turn-helix domain-containing protein [Enterococcus sp. DIV0212c]